MRGTVRGGRSGTGAVTTYAFEALRSLGRGVPDAEPVILGYHPPVKSNPFQGLLYQEAVTARIVPIPVVEQEDIRELTALARLGLRVGLHLHWLNKPIGQAPDAAAAERSGAAFLALIDEAGAAGVRTVWTVHNLLPHAARWPVEEARFRGEVARRVDLVHVMAARTRELVAPFFDIPSDRIVHIPHPSYQGAYAQVVSRAGARLQLGIALDETVYLVLGAIQGYKGIGELLDAWDALPLDGIPRRLVIAGTPSGEPGVIGMLERAALHPSVLVFPERVESDRMQLFLRSADVAVLPYLRTLNSGALMLALTFGLPVVVPADTGLADLVEPETGRVFSPGDPHSLAATLVESASLASPQGAAAAIEMARRHDPAVISRQFVATIRTRLFPPGGNAPTEEADQ